MEGYTLKELFLLILIVELFDRIEEMDKCLELLMQRAELSMENKEKQ